MLTLFSPDESHLPLLLQVEHLAWNSPGAHIEAPRDKLLLRIQSFTAGVTLATIDGQAVGSQYAFRMNWDGDSESLGSWDYHTAEGWTNRVHCPAGNTGFLVGVGVVPAYRGLRFTHNLPDIPGFYKVSELLIARTLQVLFDLGVRAVIGNARIPGYHTQPDLPLPEYCKLHGPDGRLYDPVLRFHKRMGARMLKPVDYSMEDAESRNAGCWVLYERRFRG